MEVPLEFAAAPAIVAASSVIGRQVGIYPKCEDTGWLEVPNLWGAVVARPGLLKTPSIAAAFSPLNRLASAASEEFLEKRTAALAAQEIHKAKIAEMKDTIKKAVKNKKPTELLQVELQKLIHQERQLEVHEKRYKVNDSTVEKLGELLQRNPRGLLLFRDELSGWMRMLEKIGREGDREFYLEGWAGKGPFSVDRIGRGTLHIPALCISLFGGIQPGKLSEYVADAVDGGIGDDGLLQRFQIMIYPEPPKIFKGIDRPPDYKAEQRVLTIFEFLDTLNADKLGAVCDESHSIPALHFSLEAQEMFNEWRRKLEERLHSPATEAPAFESHLNKYRGLMPSLALIFQLIDWAAGAEVSGYVEPEAARMAADWCEFLEAHARKVYAGAIQSDVYAAHALARKIKEGKVRDGATVREIYRNEWSQLRKKEHVFEALTILSDAGWVRLEQDKREGRPSDVVRLHPKLRRSDDTVRSEVA